MVETTEHPLLDSLAVQRRDCREYQKRCEHLSNNRTRPHHEPKLGVHRNVYLIKVESAARVHQSPTEMNSGRNYIMPPLHPPRGGKRSLPGKARRAQGNCNRCGTQSYSSFRAIRLAEGTQYCQAMDRSWTRWTPPRWYRIQWRKLVVGVWLTWWKKTIPSSETAVGSWNNQFEECRKHPYSGILQ